MPTCSPKRVARYIRRTHQGMKHHWHQRCILRVHITVLLHQSIRRPFLNRLKCRPCTGSGGTHPLLNIKHRTRMAFGAESSKPFLYIRIDHRPMNSRNTFHQSRQLIHFRTTHHKHTTYQLSRRLNKLQHSRHRCKGIPTIGPNFVGVFI